MGRLRRSRVHKAIKHIKKQFRTRKRTKDLDQIFEDLNAPGKRAILENQELDVDAPGMGQFYCIECSRYFVNAEAKECHIKTKAHKKRCKEVATQPYNQREAEAAVGLVTQQSRSGEDKVMG